MLFESHLGRSSMRIPFFQKHRLAVSLEEMAAQPAAITQVQLHGKQLYSTTFSFE